MQQSSWKHSLEALLAALIWGTAFVAQKVNTMGSLSFNAARSLVAVVFLFLLILIRAKGNFKKAVTGKVKGETRAIYLGGILAGIFLAIATFCQQTGMDQGTEAGKASFITAFYIVLVPVSALFFGKKVSWYIWAAIAVVLTGMYFLCVKEDAVLRPSDLYVLACSLGFTVQILLIDHFAGRCDCFKLSCVQFLTSFLVSSVAAAVFRETITWQLITENLVSIVFLGVFSSGIAYTLQIFAQSGGNAPVVTLLLSLESVFGCISGALFLNEVLTLREYVGCAVVFAGVLLSELAPLLSKKRRVTRS